MCLVLQPDAEYFHIDLLNSGEVVLSKPLDYETKTLLTVTIYAAVSTLLVSLYIFNSLYAAHLSNCLICIHDRK